MNQIYSRAKAGAKLVPALLLCWAAGDQVLAQGGGDPPSPAEEPSSFDTLFDQSSLGNVTQTAQGHFHSGHRLLMQGERLSAKALESSSDKKRESMERKALKAWESAVGEYTEAIGYDPEMLPAYAELAEVLRRLGRPMEAMQANVSALKLAPQDDANFRGWIDSMLALDMLGDLTQTYTRLATQNPARAEYVMSALEGWLDDKRADPGEMDPAHIDRLAAWIEQQQQASG